MGCGIDHVPGNVRSWNEVPGFFENWQIDGFMAYCYWSNNPNFNMFDGPSSNSTELQDGKNFFANMEKIGKDPDHEPKEVTYPACSTKDYEELRAYDTGDAGIPQNCPRPILTAEEEQAHLAILV